MADLIIPITAFLLVYLIFRYSLRARARRIMIEIKGRKYFGSIGDNLILYGPGSSFKGIDIELPLDMSHIYLDSHKNDRRGGPRFFIKQNQRIMLEGNFNNFFQAYVPKNYQVLALSILSPDVLQAILDSSEKYDIEIYGSHLRLISGRNVYNKPQREAQILQVANKILTEIDHRLQTWGTVNSKHASSVRLIMEDNPTVKFGKRNIRKSSFVFGTIFGLIGVCIWLLAFALLSKQSFDSEDLRFIFLAAFLCLPCLFLYVIIGYPRGWLNWIFKLFS